MKNRAGLYIVATLLCLTVSAISFIVNGQASQTRFARPTKTADGEISNIKNSCGYNGDLAGEKLVISLPAQREFDIIKKILSYTGLPLNFQVFSANIANAGALIIDDERIILYDPSLLKSVDLKSKTYWTSISILAHEIGHHLSGHTLSPNSKLATKELEADKFSGFVLYKMGASLENSIAAMTIYGGENDTRTHPSKVKRIMAITDGWNEAAGYRYNGAIPPPPTEQFPHDFALYTPDMFFQEKDIKTSDYYQRHKDEIEDPTIYEGVVIEVNSTYEGHPSGEPTTAFQVIIKSIRKLSDWKMKEGMKSELSVEQKFWVIYDYPTVTNCSMAQYRAFENLLKPGRLVTFSVVWEGGNNVDWYQLNHIQAMN